MIPNRQDAMSAKVEPDRITDELAHQVIGAAIAVHRTLGPGFLESTYEEALAVELREQNVPFEKQRRIALKYRDEPIGEAILDLLVGDRLLINFNVPVLKDGIKRVIVS
ncbi:MAG: GxxExxY protein [Planctomycetota bacterium]|jgi:hypothetical protein